MVRDQEEIKHVVTGPGLIEVCRKVLPTRSIGVVQLNNDDYVSEAEIENLQGKVET